MVQPQSVSVAKMTSIIARIQTVGTNMDAFRPCANLCAAQVGQKMKGIYMARGASGICVDRVNVVLCPNCEHEKLI